MGESIELSPEVIAAQLADLEEHHRRVVEQRNRDWDALMILIAQAVGTDEDRECAEMEDMEEFDPWHALRTHVEQRALLSANLTACREDLAKYRALVEQLNREIELEAKCVEARDRSIAELKSKLAEVERERTELRESLIHAVDLRTACHENERQLWAMRQTANYLGAPFSHEGVQAKYDQLCENQTDVEKRLSSALSDLAQVKARLEAIAPVDDLIDDCAWSQMDRRDLRDEDLATFVVTAMQEAEKRLEALSTSQPAKETK